MGFSLPQNTTQHINIPRETFKTGVGVREDGWSPVGYTTRDMYVGMMFLGLTESEVMKPNDGD